MKPARIVYVAVLLVSISLAWVFYYRYKLKDNELVEQQKLSLYSSEAFQKLSIKLSQNEKELEQSLEEVEILNRTIAALEKDNLAFRGDLVMLRNEKEKLQAKIDRLIQEKAALDAKFLSLEELKRAIDIVKTRKRREDRLAKIAILKKLDEIALRQGNQGFVLKEGRPTFKPPRIRVELEPIENISHK